MASLPNLFVDHKQARLGQSQCTPTAYGHLMRYPMNKKAFAELVSSVQDMGRHMRGEKVAGARVTKVREPNVRAIRRKSGLSQSPFAVLIGVNLRTLQNWEQGRTRPTGPARALLRIVEKNPKAMLTLHAA